jgi:hypothetical protein
MEPDDPRLVAAARHALHDEELVAAFAVDGEAADDPTRAKALIERCQMGRDLHADMVANGAVFKAAGTAEVVGAVRPAPRDYRLTATDAVRLRGGNALQRVAARLVDGLGTFGRPVGGTIAALGVVGLLVSSMSLGMIGLSGAPAAMPVQASAAPAPGATSEVQVGSNPDSTATTDGGNLGAKGTEAPREDLTYHGTDDGSRVGSTGPSVVVAGSIVLLVAGLALLVAGSRRGRSMPARDRART